MKKGNKTLVNLLDAVTRSLQDISSGVSLDEKMTRQQMMKRAGACTGIIADISIYLKKELK